MRDKIAEERVDVWPGATKFQNSKKNTNKQALKEQTITSQEDEHDIMGLAYTCPMHMRVGRQCMLK